MDEMNLSDKKGRGRPAKDVEHRISVRLTQRQLSVLIDIGHDFRLYPKSTAGVNTSEVVQRMLDKAADIKTRFFDEGENGILYDNIISQILNSSDEFYAMADECVDESNREHYLERGKMLAAVASLLEELNYNDAKPDVIKKEFAFGFGEKTGHYIGVEQGRKIDKKYNDKLYAVETRRYHKRRSVTE